MKVLRLFLQFCTEREREREREREGEGERGREGEIERVVPVYPYPLHLIQTKPFCQMISTLCSPAELKAFPAAQQWPQGV